MDFKDKLIKLRKLKGISQEELGYELNVTRQTVSKWELGQSSPEMEKLKQLSNFFNISMDMLTNDKELPESNEPEFKSDSSSFENFLDKDEKIIWEGKPKKK